ncbi:MAG TPA: pentapeptide repeat-containing protein [Nostocaceae cyanobacterium]|nr:pentapeptide repeat-containing protein [Nostocaceae cyanobacterium]
MPLDYSGQNLRGRSFKGQNLTSANFSKADIRGADFSNAILKGANFRGAKAGVQKRWVVALFMVMLLPLTVALIHSLSLGLSVAKIFDITSSGNILTGIVSLILVVVFFTFYIRQDLKAALIALIFTYIIIYFVLFIIVIILPKIFTNLSAAPTNIGIALILTVGFIVFSIYLPLTHKDKNEQDAWLDLAATILVTKQGTSFRSADLTDADFTGATLKNTDFRNANLTHTCFYETKLLKYARVDGTILTDQNVINLLVTGNGREKFYIGANLKGANLKGADLKYANLKEANIREATFEGACLEWANLTLTQAIGTNFTHSQMTGICIEGWNIDNLTKLDNVDCRFVYLLENPKAGTDDRERRPSSGDFKPEEFTKLFEEYLNTTNLIFRDGMGWKNNLNNSNRRIILRRNKSTVSTVEEQYKALLKAKDDEILFHRQQSAKISEMIIELSKSQPINIYNTQENQNMNNSNDSSRKIEIGTVGRDFNASGQALNLGEIDISGTVTNVINQLPNSPEPEKPGIKELLTQLQTAIEADTDLTPKNKEKALKQVKVLAEAAQSPQEKQDLAETAIDALKGIFTSLPSAASLVEQCSKILPLISQFLGLG